MSPDRPLTESERHTLEHVLSLDFVGVKELRRQLVAAQVSGHWVKGLPSVDFVVADSTHAAPIPDGPIPVEAIVLGEAHEPIGELLVWVKAGRLSALEYAWVTDEPPRELPAPERIQLSPDDQPWRQSLEEAIELGRKATPTRRAAGSVSMVGTLRRWVGFPSSTPDKDLVALDQGEAVHVFAVLRVKDRWRRGWLRIATHENPPFGWTGTRGALPSVQFLPPVALRDVRRARGKERRHFQVLQMRVLEFSAEGRDWRMGVPTIDVPLMQQAFGRSKGLRLPNPVKMERPGWIAAAQAVASGQHADVECPACGQLTLDVEWSPLPDGVHEEYRLHCRNCGAKNNIFRRVDSDAD